MIYENLIDFDTCLWPLVFDKCRGHQREIETFLGRPSAGNRTLASGGGPNVGAQPLCRVVAIAGEVVNGTMVLGLWLLVWHFKH